MKLVTFALDGVQRPGVVTDETVQDISQYVPSIRDLIEDDRYSTEDLRAFLDNRSLPIHALAGVRLIAPIPRPARNVICMGLNYAEHIDETQKLEAVTTLDNLPTKPVWFTKSTTSVCGPFDDIVLDFTLSKQYDWEVELAAIIGTAGRSIPVENALAHVHSYSVFNDLSVRDIQLGQGGQWFKGKSLDASSPLGPWLVTADEIIDPHDLQVTCSVNGEVKQRSSTKLMIFDIAAAISDISEVMTLQAGDIIATGTPSGVGLGRTPAEFLVDGDLMESRIEAIGVLRNRIRALPGTGQD